jgi:hypothetical protein
MRWAQQDTYTQGECYGTSPEGVMEAGWAPGPPKGPRPAPLMGGLAYREIPGSLLAYRFNWGTGLRLILCASMGAASYQWLRGLR